MLHVTTKDEPSFCTQKDKRHQFRVKWGKSGVFVAKIWTRFRGTNFCTCSARFAPSFVRQPNGPECTQMVRNAPKRQLRVQWDGSSAFVVKNYDTTTWHKLLYYFGSFCTEFRMTTKWSRLHINGTKMHQNTSLGSSGVDWVHRCEKFYRDFVARTFALVRPVLHRVS